MLVGGSLGYHTLRRLWPRRPAGRAAADYAGGSKLETLLGPGVWDDLADKTVVDFGCGYGHEAREIARRGARSVVGLDIRPHVLAAAHQLADDEGLADRCRFLTRCDEPADVVLSLDAFEHFGDPGHILKLMAGVLKPDGVCVVAFGPTWYHPRGGHSFSVFPWAHLVFTEAALCRWRADFAADKATRFADIDGGLNRMTVARFERLVAASPLRLASLECVPIRPLARLHNRLTREFLTSFVRARLVRR